MRITNSSDWNELSAENVFPRCAANSTDFPQQPAGYAKALKELLDSKDKGAPRRLVNFNLSAYEE